MKSNKRTQKELKPLIKAEVDTFITELMTKYPEIEKTSLEKFISDEVLMGMYEMHDGGKILTNKERWGYK